MPDPNAPSGDQRAALDGASPVLLSRSTAQQFAQTTRYVNRTIRGGSVLRGAGPATGLIFNRKVKVIADIAAASAASTPRKGTGYLCSLVSGVWTPGSDVYDVYNPSPGGIVAANSFVTVNWVEGIWEIDMDPC